MASPGLLEVVAGSYPFLIYENWLYRADFIESMWNFKPCVVIKILVIFQTYSQASGKQAFMKIYLLLCSLSLVTSSSALAARYFPEISSALKHLERVQVDENGAFEEGEWPTYVTSILFPSLAGVGRWGKPYPEATIFTTASIVNILNDMAETDPRLTRIPAMKARAFRQFESFSMDPFYNFYPLRKRRGVWVRGPRHLPIPPYVRGWSHIPPDADSTSVAYMAQKKPVPERVFQAFARFRDVNRKPHYYNDRLNTVNSGAFMTWLMDEKDPRMPRRPTRPDLGPRIPFGTNDVDCIVNANVLKLLTYHRRSDLPGYKESCRLLQNMIEQEEYGRCGVYYPNDYLLALQVGELKKLGATCLNHHEGKVLKYLLENQSTDGSWSNYPPNRADHIQATAVALNALTLLANPSSPRHQKRVKLAAQYLLRHSQRDRQGDYYWKGQVFFSAVAQARYSIVWRSSAYTTALAAQALQRAERF